MTKVNLAGEWRLSQDGGEPIPARLPGCTYLDYIANGMPDPFWGENETEAKELAKHDYTYSRSFTIEPELLDENIVELVASGLDTLCTLTLNGTVIGETNNISRTWRFDIKNVLTAGDNTLSIFIVNPYPYAAALNEKEKMSGINSDAKGSSYLRKTPCHFGQSGSITTGKMGACLYNRKLYCISVVNSKHLCPIYISFCRRCYRTMERQLF